MTVLTDECELVSADLFDPVLVLISYTFKDDDEQKTFPYQNNPICLKGRDRLQFTMQLKY